MASILYLPEDPNAELLSRGGERVGKGMADYIKKFKEDEKAAEEAKELYWYTQELVNLRRTTMDVNEAYKIKPPKALEKDAESLAKRFGIINQLWNPSYFPAEQKAEDMVSYFVPKEGADPAFAQSYEPAEQLPKGAKRPSKKHLTREEVSVLTKDKPEPAGKEAYKPTESDKLVGAELRRAKLPNTQQSRDRVRLYQQSEGDIDRYLFSQAGTFNKDLNRFEISNPQLYQKMLKVKGAVKESMYKKGQDWSEAAQEAFQKFGVEPPKEEVPPPPAAKPRTGLQGLIDRLRGKNAPVAPQAAPQSKDGVPVAPGQETQNARGKQPAAAPAEDFMTLTTLNGRDIKLPKRIKRADEAHRYLMETYQMTEQQALQILLRSHGRK